MEEKELISSLRTLSKIKPNKEWVLLTKKKILGKEPVPFFSLFVRPVFARTVCVSLLFIFVLLGLFGFSQNSLPGDALYSVKKATEKIQGIFLPEDQKPNYQIELAKKRLEELKILAEKNQTTKMPMAFKEVRETTAEVAKNLAKSKEIDQKIVENVLELEKTKKEIEEKILAAQIGIDEKENPIKIVIEFLIADLEKRSLTPEQKGIFEEAKLDFENGNFAQALMWMQLLAQQP